MSGRGRSFGANVLISFGFTGIFTGLALLNSIVIARMVGTEGRGLYALVVAVLALAGPVGTLGLHYASTWAVGQDRPTGMVAVLNHLWSVTLLLIGCAVAGAVVFGFGGLPDKEWALVVIASALTLPAAVYAELARGVLLGLKQVIRYHTIQASYGAVLLGANVLLLGWGPRAVLLTLALSYWIPAIVVLLGHLPHVRKAQLPDKGFTRLSVGYGMEASATTLVENALNRLNYLIATPIVGVAAIGLYSTADQIANMLGMGGLVAGRMMLTQSANDPDGAQTRRKLGLAVRTLLAVVGLGAVAAAATSWFLIPLVFGEEFRAAYIGLLVLLPAPLLRGAYSLVSTYLIGRDVVRPVLRAGIVALVLMLVAVPAGALTFGWLGMAAARTVVVGLQLVLTVRAYQADSGERMRWLLDRQDLKALETWARSRLGRPRA